MSVGKYLNVLHARRCMAAAIVLAIGGTLMSENALAHGPRTRLHLGFTFGAPLYWPGWYPPSYYPYYPYYYDYRPPVVVVPATPPPTVYVERDRLDDGSQRQDSAAWWYFCRDANAYYPYVKSCPGGWERVSPRPGTN